MAEPINPLVAFSDHAAQLVERTASSIVGVHGGGRLSASGIHWRSGVIITAEEVLDHDENIKITLPGGRLVEASLAGRDPSTDVAVLRFQPDRLTVAQTIDAASLRPGNVVMAIGNREGAPVASLGIVAIAGGPWQSLRGGTIDSLIHLDLMLSRAAEGGALVDAQGWVLGMAVLGPRRRVLAIPTSTIDRVVDQLLARGHVFRGYLGAGLQPVRRGRRSHDTQSSSSGRGVLAGGARRTTRGGYRHDLECKTGRSRARSDAISRGGQRRQHCRSGTDTRRRSNGSQGVIGERPVA
jgi:S1-C subfamily serine protease